MIEIEIRGELTKEQFEKLGSFMRANGRHTKSQDREMILLRGYKGYDEDPTKRDTDMRLRNTNGKCEIMLKRKMSDGNRARKEYSLVLTENTLDTAKEIVKAFGCEGGLWMHRLTEAFEYKDIEWALIEAPRGDGFEMLLYEAEMEIEDGGDITATHKKITDEAKALGLPVLETDELNRDFIYKLDKEVNREILF